MSLVKKLFLFALLLSTVGLSSCKKDSGDCEAPTLAENIIGVWALQISGGEVEFKSDGTLVDPNDGIYGVEINGIVYSDKSYTVSGNTLSITAATPDGSAQSSIDLPVTQNECNELKIDFSLAVETLTRK